MISFNCTDSFQCMAYATHLYSRLWEISVPLLQLLCGAKHRKQIKAVLRCDRKGEVLCSVRRFTMSDVALWCGCMVVFLELKNVQETDSMFRAMLICVNSALVQPLVLWQAEQVCSNICDSYEVGSDGQKDGRSSATSCSLPRSIMEMTQLTASSSCCSGGGL